MKEFACGAALALPILGIPGLPESLVSLEIIIKADDIVRIKCESEMSMQTYRTIEEKWKPVFAEYQLVKIDALPIAPEAELQSE